MSPQKRQAVLVGVMLAMLAIAAAWSTTEMLAARELARRSAADLAACERIAADIRRLRQGPKVASAEAMGVQELGKRIEAASRTAGLSTSALVGVYPQGPRRVGDTPYLRKPTSLSFRNVPLPQLASFLYHLSDGSGLNVRDLRLRTPRGEGGGDLWDAEATLTYLIYSPAGSDR